jgi:hypothetical protein
VTATDLGKTERPETIGEAIAWDRRRDADARAGLCDTCAALASWGHALGWTRVSTPPCGPCHATVAAFPEATAHPYWRKWPRGRVSASSRRSAASGRVVGCPELWATPEERTGCEESEQ